LLLNKIFTLKYIKIIFLLLSLHQNNLKIKSKSHNNKDNIIIGKSEGTCQKLIGESTELWG